MPTWNAEGRSLHYNRYGSGPAVMLVHGFGEDSRVWEGQLGRLSENHTLLVPDLPGTGDSELLSDMSLEGMAAALNRLVEQENISSLTMIGHSMGGYITLAFAELFPDKLNAFGLFHSSAFADSPEKIETRRKGITAIQQSGPLPFLEGMVPNLYAPATREQRPELIREHLSDVQYFSGATLVSYYESMIRRPDRTRVLQEAGCPVLFVLGRADTAVPLKDGLKQVYMPDLAYIHILDDSGHMGMREEPEASTELLLRFLMKTI